MNRQRRGPVLMILLLCGASLGVAAPGCQPKPKPSMDRYVPTVEAARAGLTLAMEGWLKGLTPADSGSDRPKIHVVDQTRRPDQKLVRYEILGEMPSEYARGFAVRVSYDGSEEPEIVRFSVVGIDPMWVFRQEDYDSIWVHQDETSTDRFGENSTLP